MSDTTQKDFLDAIFDGLPEDEVILLAKQLPKGFAHAAHGNGALERWDRGGGSAYYYNVSSVVRQDPLTRKNRDCRAAYVLVLDDVGTKAEAPPVEPSYKLETSEGSFHWGYILEPTEDLVRYEMLVKALAARGWTDPGAGGFNRLMRVPGSRNIKPGRGRFVSRLVSWEPSRWWTLEDLAAAFEVDLGNVTQSLAFPSVPSGGVDVAAVKGTTSRSGAPAQAVPDPLLDWLAEGGHILEDNGGEWVKLLDCPWSESHTQPGNSAAYSPLGRGAGTWAKTRGYKCQHAHCVGHKFADFSSWAEAQGGPSVGGYDPLPYLQDQYVLVVEGQMVADLYARPEGRCWMHTLGDWSTLHARKFKWAGKMTTPKDAFLQSDDTRKAMQTYYDPLLGGERALFEYKKQWFINTYLPPVWGEIDLPPTVFLEHMDYLLPDAGERDVFLDWLAWKIQNPGRRGYAVLMIADGVYGTGRSWLRQMLENMMPGQVGTATLPQLIGKGTSADATYNDWGTGLQFLVVEEARDNTMAAGDFYNGYENFKTTVDNRPTKLRVNPKYGKTRDDCLWFNCLIFSNHADALVIPPEDRRLAVLTNPTERRDRAYYERLEAALHGTEPRRLYWWLMKRDVSGYDHVYPPMTTGKAHLIEATRSTSDLVWEWILEHAEGDLMARHQFTTAVNTACRGVGRADILDKMDGELEKTTARLWKQMRNISAKRDGTRLRFGGEPQQIKALRNAAKWGSASARVIKAETAKNDALGV